MRFPVSQPYKITQGFSRVHPGTDVAPIPAGKSGVPVYAPERSRVISSAYQLPTEGEYIILQGLDSGWFYYMGHFARNSRRVSAGQIVSEGQHIADLGMTGQATGVHTHLEVRNSANAPFEGKVDPMKFFNNQGGSMEQRIKQLEATEQRLANEVVARDKKIVALEQRIRSLEATEQRLAKEVVARDKRIALLENSGDFEPINEQLYRRK